MLDRPQYPPIFIGDKNFVIKHPEDFDKDQSVQIRFKLLSDLQSYFFISLNHKKRDNVTQKYFWMLNSLNWVHSQQQFGQKSRQKIQTGLKIVKISRHAGFPAAPRLWHHYLKQQSSNTTFELKGKKIQGNGKKGDIYQININLSENFSEIINVQNESFIKCMGNLKSIFQKFHIAIGSNKSYPV
ncbi:hypothetical protein PPERSA_10305 [Pseudocohnilembus persalinus]|uniref:Uncharacterized protein n=1 Tax=Pseudocohnilembus persalinus TaxID=266149 RepID=A0A0V0R0N6_PSEPJ|nr:hypothetical protein PPERSA_10305 [Pseudocohnilembus persalinus]|eukprot:KRX07917.1 hypothetical protein PPERSA_10305 [Pseudocohnilembus persalinus]